MGFNIATRPARINDADLLLEMICRLAVLNSAEASVTLEQLREDGFGAHPWFRAVLAEHENRPLGYALWYFAYNATYGTRILHLQHLYVEGAYRRRGIGREMMAAVAREALDYRCAGIVLSVLADQTDAMGFYGALGFAHQDPPDPRLYVDRQGLARLVSAQSGARNA
jgi:diamine N-acetyltransferase